MRARDLDRLDGDPYDVLVVGGGIHGLAIALRSREPRTARLRSSTRATSAAATSFNHQKTVHGGLRSLQAGRIDRARESIRERRTLARHRAVAAASAALPRRHVLGRGRSRLALRAAFRIDAWLGRGAERSGRAGAAPARRAGSCPAPRRSGSSPASGRSSLTGGAQLVRLPDRRVGPPDVRVRRGRRPQRRRSRELRRGGRRRARRRPGQRHGACATRSTGASSTSRARAHDQRRRQRAIPDVMALFGVRRQVPMLKAMNLVTSKPASDIALAAPDRGRPHVDARPVARPGAGRHEPVAGCASRRATHRDGGRGAGFHSRSEQRLPRPAARPQSGHAGPSRHRTGRGGRPRPRRTAHARQPDRSLRRRGTRRVLGPRPQVHNRARRRGTDDRSPSPGSLVRGWRRRAPPAGRSRARRLPTTRHWRSETARDLHVDVPLGTLRHLSARYAERAADIVRLIKDGADLCEPVAPGSPTIGAEIIHAIRHEAAHHLADIVIRRSGLGSGSHPGELALRACGQLAARELGWDSERLDQEVALVDRFYQVEP